MTLAILAAVLIGFARTFFLRPLFPEVVAQFAPSEVIFYVHGVFFTAWFVLLVVQATLIGSGRVALHMRLGRLGVALAATMVALGIAGCVTAAARPTGFIGVPVPPLQFMIVPFVDVLLFAAFFTIAVIKRRSAGVHKRLMLLGSIALLGAAIARWPLGFIGSESPIPLYTPGDLTTYAFLLPIACWDLYSRGRLHPATLWGGLAIIVTHGLRMPASGTDAWLAFAGWAVRFAG